MVNSLKNTYFTLYHVIKNFRVNVISGNAIGVSKAVDATIYLTAFQIMNIKFLLEHVFFPDSKNCQSCNDFGRQGLLIVLGIAVALFNTFVFRKEGENSVVIKNKAAKSYVLFYAVSSLILLFV